jgi:hypothetical protein
MYLTQNPPGMTMALGIEELHWARIKWTDVDWN